MHTMPEMSVPAFVMNCLAPSITHSPSSRRARVRVLPASDPASGSVRPNAPSRSPEHSRGIHSRFCSSLPNTWMGCVPSEVCAQSVIATEESTRVSSSTASAYASVSPPPPPYSSGNGIPIRFSAPSFATISYGNDFVRSSSSATGATSPSANSLTVRLISSWSGDRSKSMEPFSQTSSCPHRRPNWRAVSRRAYRDSST